MNKLIALVFSLSLAVMVSADEFNVPPPPGQWPNLQGERGGMRGNRERGGMRGNRGGNRNGKRGGMWGNARGMESMRLMGSMRRILAFETIREKFPEESAALDKAMLENEQKYVELAKKAGTELQTTLECNLIKLRLADAAGYDAAIKAIKADPRTGLPKLLELAKAKNIELLPQRKITMNEGRNKEVPSSNRDIKRPDFRKLRAQFPEEMKKYEELRQQDPAKARQMLTELMQRTDGKSEKK